MNYELRKTRCWPLAGLMLACLFMAACNQSPPPAAIEPKPRPADPSPADVRAPVILRPQPGPSPFELPPEIPLDPGGANEPWQPPRLSPGLLPPAPPRER